MGVKVVTSYWDHKDHKEVETEHTYEDASTWEVNEYGKDRYYLEVIEEEDGKDPRVVAMFSEFNRVEVIDEEIDEG